MKCQRLLGSLVIAALLLAACSSNLLGASGPSDDEATKVITTQYSPYISNVIIKAKQPCELSANTKAQGVSERWVITYDSFDSFSTPARQTTDDKITIQKYDGNWVFFNHIAYCGG